MSGWLLKSISIEGLRGINNEGDPLVLTFRTDCVTSISAPNGVGKSSIFDALSFAIRGRIPKLDDLAASEAAGDYYANRFHNTGVGTVSLTLSPEGGGPDATITVSRQVDGTRVVSGPSNSEALLAELDREFVFLDHDTFQSFINERDLERGRSFSGLLGLRQYSEVRQQLQALANTRAFNGHFGTTVLEAQRRTADTEAKKQERAAHGAFQELTGKSISDFANPTESVAAAHNALFQIPLVKVHCDGKAFDDIDFAACIESIKEAEGGEDRKRLGQIIREIGSLETILSSVPSDDLFESLRLLVTQRDAALASAGSALMRSHLKTAEEVLIQESWTNKALCPTCETVNQGSVLEKVQAALASYQAVHDLAEVILNAWQEGNWACLTSLEDNARNEDQTELIGTIVRQIADHSLTESQLDAFWARVIEYRERLGQRVTALQAEKRTIEGRLPPSLVELTTRVEQAKRLKESWGAQRTAAATLTKLNREIARVQRAKRFLDAASATFAAAETEAARRRLSAVQPLCRAFFAAIIHDPVEPALTKPANGEELKLSLAKFWTLENVSAQALLAESFRNAFAVSVYLAAAKLYGGAARFMVLDDVTSSFDAGHQFHLMEVIRSQFARPGQADGPQVILLSHDTLLEKLFNKNANSPTWQHIRLEGTARTAVLPQSNAGNRVRDMTVRFLNAGQVEDGALRLRQYLEYKLLEIISRVNIPVPVDFALDDTKKQVQSALDAIQAAVALHKAAGQLVLDPQQQSGLQAHVASITGNFLAHYATGSTQAFSGSSLLGVVKAIDDYAECFTYEDPPGECEKAVLSFTGATLKALLRSGGEGTLMKLRYPRPIA